MARRSQRKQILERFDRMHRDVGHLLGSMGQIAELSGGEPPMMLAHLENWRVVCTLLSQMIAQSRALYCGQQDMPAGFDGVAGYPHKPPQSPTTGDKP